MVCLVQNQKQKPICFLVRDIFHQQSQGTITFVFGRLDFQGHDVPPIQYKIFAHLMKQEAYMSNIFGFKKLHNTKFFGKSKKLNPSNKINQQNSSKITTPSIGDGHPTVDKKSLNI